ncbi:MAG: DUF1097 domain-containing protein [Humibacillus sp.]|nr:DUF1097 domain-containing protein [Humibacillus sp.]MDN5778192.1 DUF1097 domain-containing protein [Humibacillus sp.]
MNRNLVLAAVVTGILCGAWAGVAPLVNLSIWAGFAGCTAYFASGKNGARGLFLTIATTFVGVGTALGMIAGSDLIGPPLGSAVAVGAIVTLIVLMGAVRWLAFVPGIFVGCYSTFAIDGDWRLLGLSLLAGAVLGLLCDWGGGRAVKAFGAPEPAAVLQPQPTQA